MPLVKRSVSLAGHRTSVSREPEFWAEIDRAIDDRKKLLAIKLLREQTGLGLKASKEAIEARMQSRHRMRG